jgi:hypothetical protein
MDANPRSSGALLLTLLLLLASGARAETATDALKDFGLIGSWSNDCSQSERLTYSIPWFGNPSISLYRFPAQTINAEIESVSRLTNNQIKYTFSFTSAKDILKNTTVEVPKGSWQMRIVKLDYQIGVFEFRSSDGKTTYIDNAEQKVYQRFFPLGLLQKCLK